MRDCRYFPSVSSIHVTFVSLSVRTLFSLLKSLLCYYQCHYYVITYVTTTLLRYYLRQYCGINYVTTKITTNTNINICLYHAIGMNRNGHVKLLGKQESLKPSVYFNFLSFGGTIEIGKYYLCARMCLFYIGNYY